MSVLGRCHTLRLLMKVRMGWGWCGSLLMLNVMIIELGLVIIMTNRFVSHYVLGNRFSHNCLRYGLICYHAICLSKKKWIAFPKKIKSLGNLRNFLHLRFYVKSILVILKPQKMLFRPFEQLQILNFCKLLTFSSVEFL